MRSLIFSGPARLSVPTDVRDDVLANGELRKRIKIDCRFGRTELSPQTALNVGIYEVPPNGKPTRDSIVAMLLQTEWLWIWKTNQKSAEAILEFDRLFAKLSDDPTGYFLMYRTRSENLEMETQKLIDEIDQLLLELCNTFSEFEREGNRVAMSSCKRDEVNNLLERAGMSRVSELGEFYRLCDGLSAADVNNGYFVHRLDHIVKKAHELQHVHTKTGELFEVLIFGSDGGGNLFALTRPDAKILYLHHGEVKNATYYEGVLKIRTVAPTFENFLRRLRDDIDHFVSDVGGDYKYMIDRP